MFNKKSNESNPAIIESLFAHNYSIPRDLDERENPNPHRLMNF